MIKLVCTKCHTAWYTANTAWSGDCENCGGTLTDEDTLLNGSRCINTEKETASLSE